MKKILYFFEQPKNPWVAIILLIAIGMFSNVINYWVITWIISILCADIYENIRRKSALDYVSKRWEEDNINDKIPLDQVNDTALKVMNEDFAVKFYFWRIWIFAYFVSYAVAISLSFLIK